MKAMEEEWGMPVKAKKKKGGAAAINTPDAISRAPSGAPEGGAKGKKKKGGKK